ncbi:MAG: tRNA dihydrouridine synthase DusB [Gemmatimonadetes bacterium]|nr:tRNA dihydrouridine synthase DusB [Gemmatimonadota bacterium]
MDSRYLSLFGGTTTPLFLAPQAGVSESPFRRLCRSFGADVVVSEFVSAEGIIRGNERTLDYLRFDEEERPIGVQIFGADPRAMGEAAAFVTDTFGPDFVDINFGCPVKKIVKRNGGSGCLRDLDLVVSIIRAVDAATPLPVTAKIRSGFDERSRDPVTIALRCQDAGAQVVTLHARTRADMYSGSARWEEIAAITEALDVPVVGNGDVRTGEDARRMRDETGCAGVMIARGSHGDPWLFKQARAALDGLPIPPGPTVEERFQVCLEHARNAVAYESDSARAVKEFRKHLGWYTKGLPNGKALRQVLFQVNSLDDMQEHLERYLVEARDRGWADRPVDEGSLADGVEPRTVLA